MLIVRASLEMLNDTRLETEYISGIDLSNHP